MATEISISILIVNYNSWEFVSLSLYALSRLTKRKYEVLIIDNNSASEDYLRLKAECEKYNNCILTRNETELRGSLAHGTALDMLVAKVDTPYFSVLDADATWLVKDWDERLIGLIDAETKVVGTQAPLGKPQDFPLMFASLFETKTFKDLGVKFKPKSLVQDTGYEIGEKYQRAGYSGRLIIMRNTRDYHDGPYRNVICAEYYLDGTNEIFASHFGRGSSLGSAKYIRQSIYKIPILGKYLLKIKGWLEKRQWLKISYKIINSQAHNADTNSKI